MSEFAIDKQYSNAAKIQSIAHINAVLERMYLNVRYFIPKYFKGRKRKARLRYRIIPIKYFLRAKH